MGNWIKLEVDIVTNAKIGLAGENGDRLYVVLLALHAKHGGGGIIPASRCTAAGLRIEAVAFLGKLTEKKVAKALEDCASVGLIERLPDGTLRLCGFNESHMPECSRCHRPNPEPAHGNCPACRGAKQQQRQALAAARAEKGMPGHARADGGQALSCLSLPERRGEEKRGDVDSQTDRGALPVEGNGVPGPSYPDEARARAASSLIDGIAATRRVRA
jgi:hypothetical protein